jgi:hypothetical protein
VIITDRQLVKMLCKGLSPSLTMAYHDTVHGRRETISLRRKRRHKIKAIVPHSKLPIVADEGYPIDY